MSLPSMLDARTEESPDHTAVISVRGQMSFAAWRARAAAVGDLLGDTLGPLTGERVLVWLTSDDALDFVTILHGCFRRSAIAVGVDDRATVAETLRLIEETDPIGLAISTQVAHNVGEEGLRALGLGPELAGDDESVMHLVALRGRHVASSAVSFHVAALPVGAEHCTASPADDAIIFFSSGSTGAPKGAVWTQGDLSQYVERAVHAIYARPRGGRWLDADDVLQSPIPVYTAASVMENPYAGVLAGCTVVYEERRFDADRSERRMHELGTTIYNGAPPHFAMLCDLPSRPTADTLQLMVSGGSAFTPALYHRLRERWPRVAIANWYGLMESGCGQTLNAGDDIERQPGAIGRAVEPTEVRIVDDSLAELPPDAEGELWMRAPAQMRGYFRNPEETAKRLHDGWLRTGDRAKIDADGVVHMVGRNEERINRGGFKFYPAEIEGILEEDPRVREAAVVGVPDDVLGQRAVAFVVPAAGVAVTEDELRAYVRSRVAANKVPSRILFKARFPRAPYGKVIRRTLVEEYEQRAGAGRS